VPVATVGGLLQAGSLTVVPTLSACEWFAADANVNATLAINFYASPAEAGSTFKSDQLFDPGQKPWAFGDRAYTSAIAGLPRHGVARVVVGRAIVTAIVTGPNPQVDAVAVAVAIATPATTRVRQGWHR
jgi:hypothetical protein